MLATCCCPISDIMSLTAICPIVIFYESGHLTRRRRAKQLEQCVNVKYTLGPDQASLHERALMNSATPKSLVRKSAALVASFALIGTVTTTAHAADGPFQLVVWDNSDPNPVASVNYELIWTDIDGSEKRKVLTPQGIGPIDTTSYPAGTRLDATLVMQPTYKIGKINSWNIPLTVQDFTVTAAGVGNNGQLTYKVSKTLAGNDPKAPQRFEIHGVNTFMFDHVGFNLNGGKWQPGTFQKGERLRENQQFVTPLTPIVKPVDPVRENYTFLGWSGWSEISGSRVEYPVNSDSFPYDFTEKAPVRYGEQKLIANLKAEWAQLRLTKAATGSSNRKAGEKITYKLTATNDSSAKLTELKFNDPKLDTSNCPTEIEPNKSVTCEIEYAVTQEDIDSGYAKNTATVTAKANDVPLASKEAKHDFYLIDLPKLTLVKSVTPVAAGAKPGELVDYSFEVTNKGNVTLDQIKIDDPKITDVTCNPTKLSPGESVKCTGKYTLTQADVDAGEVKNTAKATAKGPINSRYPDGKVVSSDDSSATLTIAANPQLNLTKKGKTADNVKAGDKVAYTFTVVNSGNVTIKGVTINDPKIANVTCQASELAADASTTCSGEYTLTQADIDAGKVDNTASVSGKDPKGNDTKPAESTVTVELKQQPKLELEKKADKTEVAKADESVAYTFTVKNTGNVTVKTITIDDKKIANVNCTTAELAPGAETECNGEYKVTQAEIDAGDDIVNTATAIGQGPKDAQVKSNQATATVKPVQQPKLELTKKADKTEVAKADETVAYTFTVKNTGNVTVKTITIDDKKIANVTCTTAELAPGAETECNGEYEVAQADIDAGEIVNTATAKGEDPKKAEVKSNESTAKVTAKHDPKLTLTKTASPTSGVNAGDKIAYSFTVKNEGNVTITKIAVNDPKIETVTCEASELAPAAATSCTGEYTVTAADVAEGKITNTAHALGNDPADKQVKSNDATANVTTKATETPKPTPTGTETPKPTPTGTETPKPTPTGTETPKPVDPTKSTDPTPSNSQTTKPTAPASSTTASARPSDPKPSNSADGTSNQQDKSNKKGVQLPKTGSSLDIAGLVGVAAFLSVIGAGALARRRRD